jgi:hypothetical protein
VSYPRLAERTERRKKTGEGNERWKGKYGEAWDIRLSGTAAERKRKWNCTRS